MAKSDDPMLVHRHNGGIDHLHSRVMSGSECMHDLHQPTNDTIVVVDVWAKALQQIAPRCAGSQNPKDAI